MLTLGIGRFRRADGVEEAYAAIILLDEMPIPYYVTLIPSTLNICYTFLGGL